MSRRLAALLLAALLLAGCGFHLRGASSVVLPPELNVMRVTMGRDSYPPLLVEMRNALLALGAVRLTDDISAEVPVLRLYGETSASEVLAVDSSGRVSGYVLNYRVDFSLDDGKGKALLPRQPVKLQREYTFDRLNVLATEKQSDFLQNEMRRDAAQQILRRLASLNFASVANGHADQP
jgi:LPS-assembly lipoprotein